MKVLDTHQEKGAGFLAARESALLADEPRVGKTLAAIRACDRVGARLVLILAPAHVCGNWVREVENEAEYGWTAVIVAHSMAKKFLVRMRQRVWDVVIVDEAHAFKSPDAIRTRALFGDRCTGPGGIIERAKRVWFLTGTPMPNHPGELWAMLRATAPALIMRQDGKRPMPYSEFEAHYCKKIRTPFGMKIVGAKNIKLLREKLGDFMLRRTRVEVFGRDIREPTRFYVDAENAHKSDLAAMEQSEDGRVALKALREGGITALRKQKKPFAELRRITGLAKVPGVAALVKDELIAEPDSKICLICYHTDVIDAMFVAMQKFGVLIFDGRNTPAKRHEMSVEFQTTKKHRVGLLQVDAAGVGIDLSAADDAIFVEQSYVDDYNKQAMARIFNSRKERPCTIRYAVLRGSMDEDIHDAALGKMKIGKAVFA